MKAELLHVVTCYYNPIRWESRFRLTADFIEHMLDSGVQLTVVECQLGERPFEFADFSFINHVPVRSKTLLWNKESLIRVGMSRFDPDWKYMAWSDSDIYFRKSDWASETVHALQQYDVIQPWSDAYDLGPNDSHLASYKSFMHQYWWGKSVVYGIDPEKSSFEKRVQGIVPSGRHAALVQPANRLGDIAQHGLGKDHPNDPPPAHPDHPKDPKAHPGHPGHPKHPHDPDCKDHDGKCNCCHCHPCCCPPCPPPYYGMVGMDAEHRDAALAKMPWWKRDGGPHEYPHTGYVWAATRHAIESLGGLFDIAAMGAGDYHMALAMIGYADRSMPSTVAASYRKHLKEWETRALRDINYNVGYIQGTIEHNFHGRKTDRRYIDRWQIALEHGFDPDTDIMKNSHGVLELTCRKPKLRHDLDVYLRQRNEDANTL